MKVEALKASGAKFDLPWLQLGIKQDSGGVKATGKHLVKILEEPVEGKDTDPITGKERDVFLFLLEEAGAQKKWKLPIFYKDGSPHYLLSRFENIPVGATLSLEMKRKGMKNYIEVGYPVENEEEIPIIEDEKGAPDNIPF